MDNFFWSCIWSHCCRSRSGIKITPSTYLVFFQSANFKASSLFSRCEKPATKNQFSVAAFFYYLHNLNLVLFQHLFSVQLQLTDNWRHGNLMLSISTFNFLSSSLFLKRGNGVYFSALVPLGEFQNKMYPQIFVLPEVSSPFCYRQVK